MPSAKVKTGAAAGDPVSNAPAKSQRKKATQPSKPVNGDAANKPKTARGKAAKADQNGEANEEKAAVADTGSSTTRRRSARVSIASEDQPKDGPTTKPAEKPAKAPSKRKKKVSEPNEDVASAPLAPPETPKSKRRKVVASDAVPETPTRPAGPHVTNAPLKTPGGTKVVAYPPGSVDFRGSNLPKPTTTTSNLLDDAIKHILSVDPKLQAVIDKHHCTVFSPAGLQEVEEPFEALCRSIISQQVRELKPQYAVTYCSSP